MSCTPFGMENGVIQLNNVRLYHMFTRSLSQSNPDAQRQQNKLQPALSEAMTELQYVICILAFWQHASAVFLFLACFLFMMFSDLYTHTHLTALCPGLPGWAGTRKVKTNLDFTEEETVSSSGISWAVCKSAPQTRQLTTPAPHCSVFFTPDALPAARPTASKHWRHKNRNS